MATTKTPAYETLTVSSGAALAVKLGLFSGKSTITCQEIGNRNRNRVFRVRDQENNRSIIIKQVVPFGQLFGESLPLRANRARIESSALIRQAEHVPHLVPKIYYSDTTLAVIVMEDLSHLSILRKGLIEGKTYPLFSEHVGEFLGKTLFYNSAYFLDPQVKNELEKQFSNPDLCAITEKLLFTDPFFASNSNEFEEELRTIVKGFRDDSSLLDEASKLRNTFTSKTESLIHGDLHTGSIFSNQHVTKIIDPEFAFFGPIGFDIGKIIADLLIHTMSHDDEKSSLLHHIITVWTVFSNTFKEAFRKDCRELYKTKINIQDLLYQIFADAAGFAGCELIRYSIGAAQDSDINPVPIVNRIERKSLAIRFGLLLIKERENLQDAEGMITLLTQLEHE
ncbi:MULTISPECIES: S-methyl-5-thioribose kinase [Bacillus]|uniref:S-methyl-5-thioribose kinase n=2 Tax=Bacillus TaxID=1386 RepID=A0A0M4FVQ9_9BACI|nr:MULTISPECIES: S-methyl-5-thioribose kinase [Bacillus]ALC80850.1 methylthioribose kinase [Bacillus gobiensis]MBP1079782.1 5-methylthioribose kinase [Bacillus capparidis]MED1095174.1 S-methyl-5-thioribose kinase [Bacillus capparidis]